MIFKIGYSVFMKSIFEISEELFCNGFAKKFYWDTKADLILTIQLGCTLLVYELFYSPTASATATSALTTASTAVTTSASTATTTASTAATSASTAAT